MMKLSCDFSVLNCALFFLLASFHTIAVKALGFTMQDPDQFRDTIGIIRSRGFIAEEHFVTTADGYILSLHRVVNPCQRSNRKKLKPLLFMHGILASSSDWVLGGQGRLVKCQYIENEYRIPVYRSLNGRKALVGNSLAFVLSQFGYDVWLANARGNTFSRNHTKYNYRFDKRYWQFSLNEMVDFDLPSMIRYVLRITRSSTLGYIAHSQGSLLMFALMASQPKYQQIVKPFVALAPIVFVSHVRVANVPISAFTPLTKIFSSLRTTFLPASRLQFLLQGYLCRDIKLRYLCGLMLGSFVGFNFRQLDFSKIGRFASKFPTGLPSRVVAHYLQMAASHRFQRYDYGQQGNLMRYGQTKPPLFDLNRIRSHNSIALVHGANDPFANMMDVERLKRRLRVKLLDDYLISDPKWSHFDFQIARDANFYVNARLIDLLRKSEFLNRNPFQNDYGNTLYTDKTIDFNYTQSNINNFNIVDTGLHMYIN